MTILSAALFAAIAVAPQDRLGMADRLFNRGEYAAAKAEYAALEGASEIAVDELAFRRAECERALGDAAAARDWYARLLAANPLSSHAPGARLERALLGNDAEKREELRLLDTDSTPAPTRAAALYHLGELVKDPAMLERACELDPKGRYAPYARLACANLLAESSDAAVRRKAVSLYLELAFGPTAAVAEAALYLGAVTAFRDKRYGEAGSLLMRYLKKYPESGRIAEVTDFCAWCQYLSGRHAEAVALCGEGRSEDTAFVRAAATQALGEAAKAKALYARYLEEFPTGRYRKDAELPLARLAFDEAAKTGDAAARIAAAKRGAELSGAAGDLIRLGWAYEQAERGEDAMREYLAVAAKFPGSAEAAEAMFRKGMLDLRAKRWSAGELALKEALTGALDARHRPEATYWRGVAMVNAGHPAEGCAVLKEAERAGLTLDQSREARLMIAAEDYNAGRTNEAVAAYAKLIREGAAERMSAANLSAVARLLAPAERKLCARALVRHEAPEWRQVGYAILGDAEAAEGAMTAAAEAWKRCLAEPCVTEVAAPVAVSYGGYLVESGSPEAAEPVLKRAVELNAKDDERRAAAYLALARGALARKDFNSARGYATVVVTLFEPTAVAGEAKKLLELPEVKE